MSFQQQPPCLVRWGAIMSPHTPLVIGITEDGAICRIAFAKGLKASVILKEWRKEWPQAVFVEDKKAAAKAAWDLSKGGGGFKLYMVGTKFQHAVWKELLKIPAGKTISYAEVARRIKNPKAVRAVGTACGANPVPILVPCHRVIGSDGRLGGFGGGLALKQTLLKAEGIYNEAKKAA